MASKAQTTEQTSGKSGPWQPAVKPLKQFLADIGGMKNFGPTADQQAAFASLKANAQAGNPYAAQTGQLATDAFNTADRTGMVSGSLSQLQNQLGDYASGKYLDPMSNPQMQAMLAQVGDDAANRINAQFAGAGRDLSGINQMAVGRGVTQATLPLLLDQYNRAQSQQFDAAKTLYGAGSEAAQTMSGLDQMRQALRAQGIDIGQSALDAQNYGANAILDLEQQLKDMPLEDASLYASLLYPAAGLGSTQTSSGTATSKMKPSLLSLFSDARVKEDIEPVGKLADGTSVYKYRYKDDPTYHIGVMAQEVEEKTPEAVSKTDDGIRMVNYDAATKRAAEILKKRRSKGSKY